MGAGICFKNYVIQTHVFDLVSISSLTVFANVNGFYSPVPLSWNLWGEEVDKDEANICLLWHEMSVKNTNPKYIGR